MTIDFSNYTNVHFIGIGGVGISSLARLLLSQGKTISGTNDSVSPNTLDELRAKGVVISLEQTPDKLPDAQVYIYSDAWLTNNMPMIEAARAKNVPVLSYFEALGAVSEHYKVIAVSGAHGKTTTTSMIADVLEDAGFEPTVVVGSLRAKTKSNFTQGTSEYLVVEADEYRRHFLNFTPNILVILNIDDDHLDYYKDIDDIKSAFTDLVEKIPKDGYLVCNLEMPHVVDVARKAQCTVVDYELFGDQNLVLKVPGDHNLSNAAAVLAVADVLGISRKNAEASLKNFSGTWRRFEEKGVAKNGALIFDDYGHHPTEVRATLRGARSKFPDKRITVVFQPHLFSRTKQHLKEFGESFSDVDMVILAPIYAAREAFDPTITSEMLAQEIVHHGGTAVALPSLDAVETHIKKEISSSRDVLITMGAGDIYLVGEKFVA
jgi:UDP-N-acetylmuramate--alanine ligase